MYSSSQSARAALVLALALCCGGATAAAQSGRGAVRGYVAFEDVAYNDLAKKKVRARIELRDGTGHNRGVLYTAETDERGSFGIESVSAGEYVLLTTSPGYAAYEIEVYLPSDFVCSRAVMLKRPGGKGAGGGRRK